MAAQTLTDVTRNYDDAAISGLLNGETITLNNSTLIINSDVRWGQQAAVCGAITISATLGGVARLDGRDVWWMPYDAATGNVPALGVLGVQNCTGGTSLATGEFLGIFTALGVAPSTAGGAMPATGFIKFRSKVGDFLDNEVVTLPGGATITVNSATGGQRGWIHVVGGETTTITVPRLGKFEAFGDWFELGVTNGADDQTFNYPVTDNCPAIQIETAVGSGVYEWYLNAGGRWGTATQFVPTDVRGKYYGQDNATGIITIARRATNACGYKPVSGLRVRIPNILISSSTATNWNLNTINATLATRWDFTTTSAGDIQIDKTCGNWFLSLTSAFQVLVENSAFLQSFIIQNTASTTTFTNVAVGLNSTTEFAPVAFINLFTGGDITGLRAARYASTATGNVTYTVTDCVSLNFIDCMAEIFGSTTAVTRGNATVYAALFTRCNDFTMTNFMAIGSRVEFSQCARITCTGLKYADQINGNTPTTNPQFAFVASNATTNVLIDGFSNFAGIANQHPYSGIISITNAFFIDMRNIGTALAPYNCGSANATGLIASSVVSTDLTFRRIYCENTRTGAFLFANTVQNVTAVNVWCDGADSQAIAAINITPQGCRWTNSVTAQLSVYSRHWEDAFTAATTGRILIAMNEPLAATADQCEITAGTPAFTSGGQVAMKTLGDQVTWTMPYFCLGYTSLANIAPTVTGTNTGNFSYEYQIDTGSGFGAYKALTGANLSSETISPTDGFRLRVRVTTTVANATNALTYLRIDGVTNAVDQRIQYPLPFDALASITGLVPGSRVHVYNVTTATEIRNEIVPGTSFVYGYYNGTGVTAGDVLRIRICYVNGTTARLPQQIAAVAGTLGFSALASQELDTVYNTNAIDGSLVTELTADFPNIQIDSNDVDGETTVQRMYAWFANNQFSALGIQNFFGAMIADDLVNYQIRSALVNLKIDNIIATPLMIIGGRLYRDDGATVIAATSNSIQLDPQKAYGVEVGTSGLTPEEAATLEKLDTLTEDVGGLRFTTKALEQAPSGGGGGSLTAADVWTYSPRTLTSSFPSVPTAAENATAVRSELATELGRIDVATSSRLATAGYTAPPTAAAIRSEIDANSTKLDVAVGTRLPTASYVAPANADIAAIKAKTDNLPAAPASEGSVTARPTLAQIEASTVLAKEATVLAIPSAPSAAVVASAVRTELATELGRVDATVSSRLPTSGYTAPANADVAAIKAKTDNLPADPADNSEILAAISAIPGGSSPGDIADAVRTELAPELARVDVAISTRNATAPDNSGIAAIKAKTDSLPASPASEGNVSAVGSAVLAVDAKVDVLPTLPEIEASTVLAKEATSAAIKAKTDTLENPDLSDLATSAEIAEVKKNTDLIPATV